MAIYFKGIKAIKKVSDVWELINCVSRPTLSDVIEFNYRLMELATENPNEFTPEKVKSFISHERILTPQVKTRLVFQINHCKLQCLRKSDYHCRYISDYLDLAKNAGFENFDNPDEISKLVTDLGILAKPHFSTVVDYKKARSEIVCKS